MLSLVFFLITCLLFWQWHTRKRRGDPPLMPGLLPFVGHAHFFFGDTLNLWKAYKHITHKCMEMGHALVLYIGPMKIYVLTDPEDIYQISNTFLERDEFVRRFTKGLLADGLFFSEVPTWKKHRKIINRAFHQQILDSFMAVFNSQGRKLTKNFENEMGRREFDCRKFTHQNTIQTIYLSTVGDTLSDKVATKYIEVVEKYINLCTSRFQNILLYPDVIYKYSNLKRKIDGCLTFFEGFTDYIIKRKELATKLNNQTESDKITKHKVKLLIDVLMDTENGFTHKEINYELHTILIAGLETSADLMEFALILIGSHPKVQERLYNEIQEVLQDRDAEKQDLSKLVYLDAVLKETMRYYVIVPLGGRFIEREIKLKNCVLRPGNCLLLFHGIHRNSEWGPDVNEFRPERWLDTDIMQKNPNLFVAFGMGRRSCIGKSFAMMSVKIILSHVLRRYKIHADHTKVIMKMDFVLKLVSGYNISVEDRLKV